MTRILLINPNATQATTDMMVRIAQAASGDIAVVGATAHGGPPIIMDAAALASAAAEVVDIGSRLAGGISGIIVGAFGDPGLSALQARCRLPVVGLAEASMRAAARGDRRFGIATTTPALVGAIDARVTALGLGHLYTGTRLTPGDPLDVMGDPDRLIASLAGAVEACVDRDAAQAVIIGGGPLGNAATALSARFSIPVIAPIPAAVRRLVDLLHGQAMAW